MADQFGYWSPAYDRRQAMDYHQRAPSRAIIHSQIGLPDNSYRQAISHQVPPKPQAGEHNVLDQLSPSSILLSPSAMMSSSFPASNPPAVATTTDFSFNLPPGYIPSYQYQGNMTRSYQEQSIMSRYVNETSDPWNSTRVSTPTSLQYRLSGQGNTVKKRRLDKPDISWTQHREGPKSDGESLIPHSDSGYATKSLASRSVLSADPADYSQECEPISVPMNDLQVGSQTASSAYSHDMQKPTSDHSYGRNILQSQNDESLKCDFTDCHFEAKCLSELKKHRCRHTKPFRCDVSGCTIEYGFTTSNDRDRHKKSIHNIGNSKEYRCMAKSCNKKDKTWPRLDNFRQHIKRIHPDEDVEELVKKSEQAEKNSRVFDAEVGSCIDPNMCVNTLPSEYPNTAVENTLSRQGKNRSTSTIAGINSMTTFPKEGTVPTTSVPPFMNNISGSALTEIAELLANIKKRTAQVDRLSKYMGSAKEQVQPSNESNLYQSKSRTSSVLSSNIQHQSDSTKVRDKYITSSTSTDSTPSLQSVEKQLGQLGHMVQTVQAILSGQSQDQRGSSKSSSKTIQCTQPGCGKMLERPCDLRKHQKRHLKPYGCTFPNCCKSFGSKNDWKRHENSQHFQLETWRCQLPDVSYKTHQCARVFYRREPFTAHLRQHHDLSNSSSNNNSNNNNNNNCSFTGNIKSPNDIEAQIRHYVKISRIGQNGQGQFWCGFCHKIIPLRNHGLEAWDERFNHIDNLHFKKGENIDQWVQPDGNLEKGMIERSSDEDEGSEEAWHGSREQSHRRKELEREREKGGLVFWSRREPIRRLSPTSTLTNPANTSSSPSSSTPKREQETKMWKCCTCSDGINILSNKFENQCTMCSHRKCGNCPDDDDAASQKSRKRRAF